MMSERTIVTVSSEGVSLDFYLLHCCRLSFALEVFLSLCLNERTNRRQLLISACISLSEK